MVVTGKGGVGKSTVAAALGIAAAKAGLRTVVSEVGSQGQVPRLLGAPAGREGRPEEAGPGLWTMEIEPDEALAEWLRRAAGHAAAALLTHSATLDAFVAAAPGARELIVIGKVWDLLRDEDGGGTGRRFDLVILDAPSTGHAVALLRAPTSYAGIARGPVGHQAADVRDALAANPPTAIVGVAEPADLPVTELLFLERRLREELGRGIDAAVVNRRLPRRFTGPEVERVERRLGGTPLARACRTHHTRRAGQDRQVARLHRELPVPTVELPYVIAPALGPADTGRLAEGLGRRLDGLLPPGSLAP